MIDPTVVDRLRAELTELNTREVKLQAFVEGSTKFDELEEEERELLRLQLATMAVYSRILQRRMVLMLRKG